VALRFLEINELNSSEPEFELAKLVCMGERYPPHEQNYYTPNY